MTTTFFSLPGGLRNQIYGYLVITGVVSRQSEYSDTDLSDSEYSSSAEGSGSIPSPSSGSPSPNSASSDATQSSGSPSTEDSDPIAARFKQRRRPVCPPPVTQVCCQLRAEALSMYYAKNVFVLPEAIYTADKCKDRAVFNAHIFDL
jgi:hypothetical protein